MNKIITAICGNPYDSTRHISHLDANTGDSAVADVFGYFHLSDPRFKKMWDAYHREDNPATFCFGWLGYMYAEDDEAYFNQPEGGNLKRAGKEIIDQHPFKLHTQEHRERAHDDHYAHEYSLITTQIEALSHTYRDILFSTHYAGNDKHTALDAVGVTLTNLQYHGFVRAVHQAYIGTLPDPARSNHNNHSKAQVIAKVAANCYFALAVSAPDVFGIVTPRYVFRSITQGVILQQEALARVIPVIRANAELWSSTVHGTETEVVRAALLAADVLLPEHTPADSHLPPES